MQAHNAANRTNSCDLQDIPGSGTGLLMIKRERYGYGYLGIEVGLVCKVDQFSPRKGTA